MGIVPDLSAIRSVSKKKKRIERKPTINYSQTAQRSSVLLSDVEKRNAEKDAKAISRMRCDDITDLVHNLKEDSDDEVIVGDTDGVLTSELRRQRLKESVIISAGFSLKDTMADYNKPFKTLASSANVQIPTDIYVDSDGDIDINEPALARREVPNLPTEVTYRDEDGRRITKARWLEIQALKKGGYKVKKLEEAKHKKYEKKPAVAWGIGVIQEEEKKLKQQEELELQSQPLTRYDIEKKYDKELKETVRWDDPCRYSVNVEEPVTGTVPISETIPKCRFAAPPNRFKITPGYRWDGVIRGNGFESRLLKERNKKLHQSTEAYKWSIEEM